MGVKIVKGIAGQLDATASGAYKQALKSSSSSSTVSVAASQNIAASGDAVVTSLRSSRPEAVAEKLTVQKAEKVAKELGDAIREDEKLAMGAIGNDFSISAVRDAFGV